VRGGQLHRLVDAAGAHVQGAPENSRKRQHVVDLREREKNEPPGRCKNSFSLFPSPNS